MCHGGSFWHYGNNYAAITVEYLTVYRVNYLVFYLNTIDIIIRHEVQIQYLQIVKGLSRWA